MIVREVVATLYEHFACRAFTEKMMMSMLHTYTNRLFLTLSENKITRS